MEDLQIKIISYKPNKKAIALVSQIQFLVIAGPTASGKNTLINELLKTNLFIPIITHTTRPPRINLGVPEKEGSEYHFITDEEAIKMLDDQQFIEVAYTHGHLYGTSIQEFQHAYRKEKIAIADIDIKGVKTYRLLSDKIIPIFLMPPSFNVLIERLIKRYGSTEATQDIQVRLTTAIDELYEMLNDDYYYVIVNHNIKDSTKKVLDILKGRVSLKSDYEVNKLAKQIIQQIKAYLANLPTA
jgi:guanylate kinase